jgi:uncharacterized protein (DUF1778 family)
MAALAIRKDARLDLKTTMQNKELLAHAASLRGVDMTTFIMTPALEAAREIVEHHEKITLEKQEQLMLYTALSQANKPTEGLKELLSAGAFNER